MTELPEPNIGKYYIPWTSESELGFAEHHFSEEEKWEKIRSIMRERKFTIRETMIPHRVMNHWVEKGLLPDGVKKTDGWRRFTSIEIAWLWIISSLRDFGMSLEDIARVKKLVMPWDKNYETYQLLEYFFARAILSPVEAYVVVFKEKDDYVADIASSVQIELFKSFHEEPVDMLLISLKGIGKKMGYKNIPSPEILHSISDGEIEILEQVRSGAVKEFKTRLKNGKVSEIENVEVYPNTDSSREIKRILEEERAFAEVTTKYADGKKQSLEVRRRRRIE